MERGGGEIVSAVGKIVTAERGDDSAITML